MANRKMVCVAVVLSAVGVVMADTARADGPDLIAVRQAAFALNGGDFAFIRSVVGAKGDVKPLEVPAKAIAKWAAVIPTMFPKGTETGDDTKALPEIWSDMAGFQKAAMTMGTVANKLADSAKAGDAEAVAADTKALGESCGGCHRPYRAK